VAFSTLPTRPENKLKTENESKKKSVHSKLIVHSLNRCLTGQNRKPVIFYSLAGLLFLDKLLKTSKFQN